MQELVSFCAEEDEAEWVDNNRSKLIQTVTIPMALADELLGHGMIHKEAYSNIEAARTPEDKMRHLYKVLNSTKAKSVFYRILKKIQPQFYQTEDVIKNVIQKHKELQRVRFTCQLDGIKKDEENSLDKIYTELHIVQGESEHVNAEHEIWEIEDKARSRNSKGTEIHCNDIFQAPRKDIVSPPQKKRVRAIRTVMTKGIAGIGKTVSAKKFILDWADGEANQDLDFIFMLPFRELNLVINDRLSLEMLLKEFQPELKDVAVPQILDKHKVLFIFDGLDETQFSLQFNKPERISDPTRVSSVDSLVKSIIRGSLVPSALVWITSRPGAVQRIPREYIHQWTEVRGFDDHQKMQYFRNRCDDKSLAEKIICHVKMSRSLNIMCHIPIFCWISAKVFTSLLPEGDTAQDESIVMPTTLTEMYTHFIRIQTHLAAEKYSDNNVDTEEIFELSKEFLLKLGKLAFEQLEQGKIIFTVEDLKNYGISKEEAGVYCGLCTEFIDEQRALYTKKLYCFVHLTVQEYFAALFVYHSFANKKIDSPRLKNFLLVGSEPELKTILEQEPVELPLDELIEISIANSALRNTAGLDMFLRFLIGLSLQLTQQLLHGLIQQEDDHSKVVEEIKISLREIDLQGCSAERCLNLVHCLIELKDTSIHEAVLIYLRPNHVAESHLSPVMCSALAYSILMSSTPLDEFNLQKFRPSLAGIFRLMPAVRNSKKVRISGVDLDNWITQTIFSAFRMPNSVLTELHLINCVFNEQYVDVLIDGLEHSECKLEALSFSGRGHLGEKAGQLASAVKSVISNLRELELSSSILGRSLLSVLPVALASPKLETLRLNRNGQNAAICQELVKGITCTPSNLQELEMNYTNFTDSEVKILSTVLSSKYCALKMLSLSNNKLTEKSCEFLALVLSSGTSHVNELDLSYNDLQDLGVRKLCEALSSPSCVLKTLRLSFCKVTADGCASLASALRSEHCSLGELDLSFNHLGDQGANILTEIQKDTACRLETLNVDQNEEFWYDLKLLRQYTCDLTLDPNTAGFRVVLTEDNMKAEGGQERQDYPEHPDRFAVSQVLCEEGLTGRHYWEVQCIAVDVGVAYKSIDRVANDSRLFGLGDNEKSFCWKSNGEFMHNHCSLKLHPPTTLTIGVYLDWPAGVLSFFSVSNDTLTHQYTFRATFTEPLHPGFNVQDGWIHLCKKEVNQQQQHWGGVRCELPNRETV